jgi:DNA-binding GntR family transcriptional regulator
MLVLEKNPHPSLVDRLVEHVFDSVVAGTLAPGSKVTEEQIAADFGVSRTPVREAIKRLAELGVLVVHPRCGLEVVSFDAEDLKQIGELREELEVFALRLALPRLTDRDYQTLEQIATQC